MGPLDIRREADGRWVVAPAGAHPPGWRAPRLDTMVLEVAGGHLFWQLLDGERTPCAVLDDALLAQEWLWAIYGEPVALAIADGQTGELTSAPALPELAATVWRLGYAHWADRWWPASTIDGIARLDQQLLDTEIATLTEECELLVDGADALVTAPTAIDSRSARADDYALAAGGRSGDGALVLSRGVGGWDWRRCPAGLLDASEQSVSWEVVRAAGATTVRVSAVAAPGLGADIPAQLRPQALVRTELADAAADLTLIGDAWTGETGTPTESVLAVDIRVPGVGAPESDPADPQLRRRIRALAADRLRRARTADDTATDAPLLAEIAAATDDPDF